MKGIKERNQSKANHRPRHKQEVPKKVQVRFKAQISGYVRFIAVCCPPVRRAQSSQKQRDFCAPSRCWWACFLLNRSIRTVFRRIDNEFVLRNAHAPPLSRGQRQRNRLLSSKSRRDIEPGQQAIQRMCELRRCVGTQRHCWFRIPRFRRRLAL